MNRYESTKSIKDSRREVSKYESTTYPVFERKETDIYIITRKLERLDLLSSRYYGDARFWWVIASANNIGKGTLVIPAGKQIRIPQTVNDIFQQLEESQTSR